MSCQHKLVNIGSRKPVTQPDSRSSLSAFLVPCAVMVMSLSCLLKMTKSPLALKPLPLASAVLSPSLSCLATCKETRSLYRYACVALEVRRA